MNFLNFNMFIDGYNCRAKFDVNRCKILHLFGGFVLHLIYMKSSSVSNGLSESLYCQMCIPLVVGALVQLASHIVKVRYILKHFI